MTPSEPARDRADQPDQAWHLGPVDIQAYTAGTTAPATTLSAEAHLIRCATCRGALASTVDPRPLRLIWDAVVEDVTAPSPSWVERVAVRVGVSERDAVLVAAAPALRSSWVLGLLTSLLLAVMAASDPTARGSLLFLAVAPLLPVGAVAVAYGRELDPLWETTVGTPYPRLRLVLIRALAVIALALPLTMLAAPLLSGPVWVAGAWLLPTAACVSVALALATWFDVTRAGVGVGAAWVALVVLVAGPGLREPLLVLAEPLLVVYALIAVVASLVFWRRCDAFSVIGRST